MAKKVRSAEFDSRAARTKLAPRGKPYYRSLGLGLHLGYRKAKTGDGRWVVRFYGGDKEYSVETIASADDRLDANGTTILDFWQAQDRAREIHANKARGSQAISPTYTVKEAIDDYLRYLESEKKTAKDSRYRAEALILPDLGDKAVAKLTAKEIEDWRDKIAETPPRLRTQKGKKQKFRRLTDNEDAKRQRQASANRVLTILKAALTRVLQKHRVAWDAPWQRVKPFGKADAARVRYLTIAEAQRLINASEPTFCPMVQAGLQTGARYGELAALKVSDFNPDVGTVHIRQSKAGKGRHIVLTDEGAAFFKRATAGRSGEETMFSGSNGTHWGKSHQSRPMAEACKQAKIAPPITFHGLRHTWASLAVMNGVHLMVVAKNLGHSDTRMVEKHYGHLADSFVRDSIRANAPRFDSNETTNVSRLDGVSK